MFVGVKNWWLTLNLDGLAMVKLVGSGKDNYVHQILCCVSDRENFDICCVVVGDSLEKFAPTPIHIIS